MTDKFLSTSALLDLVPVVISPLCRKRYERCVRNCYRTRDQQLATNQAQRGMKEFQRLLDLSDCSLQNMGNDQARIECQRQVNAAADAAIAHLDAAAYAAFDHCMAECSQAAKDCDNEARFYGEITLPTVTIEVECIDGTNAPCFMKVRDICKKISEPCDDCWKSLCGESTWIFESDLPLTITLVAATDPEKNARVLSRTSRKGKLASLPVPKDIKLARKEQLYIGFSLSKKPAKPVQVIVHRSKQPALGHLVSPNTAT
jgi:hypothetical protein